MKINYNSLNARLYRWFYCTNNMPDNLCPYFWKLALSVLLFIPAFVLRLPVTIINLTSYEEPDNKLGTCIGVSFAMWFVVLFVGHFIYGNIHLIKYWMQTYSYDSYAATVTGVVDSLIVLVLIFYYRTRKKRVYREQKPSIIGEFIRAKYGKYCPKITWEESIKV